MKSGSLQKILQAIDVGFVYLVDSLFWQVGLVNQGKWTKVSPKCRIILFAKQW